MSVALDLWHRDGGRSDMLAHLDRAIDALVDGLGELRMRRQAHTVRAKQASSWH